VEVAGEFDERCGVAMRFDEERAAMGGVVGVVGVVVGVILGMARPPGETRGTTLTAPLLRPLGRRSTIMAVDPDGGVFNTGPLCT
jgi:hypothetical protein